MPMADVAIEHDPPKTYLAPDKLHSEKRSTDESSDWLRELSTEKRAALRAMHDIVPVWNLVAVLYPLMWLGGAMIVASTPLWPLKIVGYLVIGIALHAMAILTHEASHLSMFRSPHLDRWVGFLMGAPVFISYTAYKSLHADHHKYTRNELDPDEFLNVTNSRFVQSILFYSWLIIGTPVYVLHVAVTGWLRGTRRDRVNIVVEYLLLAAMGIGVLAAAWRYGRFDLIIHCWAIPMIVAMVFGNLRSWAEHAMTVPGNPLTRTRTVTSNRVVSFLMFNLNYHLEHHLCPAIPWYHLPKMHVLLKDEYRRAGSIIYKSYWRFLWDALTTGVHGLALPSM